MVYKRLLTGLFICLFSFLLMSHNTNALEIYSAFTRSYNYSTSALVWYGSTPGSGGADWHSSLGNNNNNGGIAFSPGDNNLPNYVSRIVLAYTQSWGASAIANIPYRICFNNPGDMSAFIGFSGNGYSSVISNEFTYTSGGCLSGHLNVYVPAGINNIYLGGNNGGSIIGSMPNNDGFSIVFGITTFLNVPYNGYTDVLNAIKNNTDDIEDKLDEIADSADAALDREQSETQDAADDSSTAGSSASSQSQQATSSLLSTITGFFNAIIGVNPSNCKFNSNLPFLQGNGEIDLCSISTPPIVQTLSSLVLVGLFIPFCIHMFNRFVSITESFQR